MRHLDRIAGAFALVLLLALAGAWAYVRLRPHETPRFEPARFVPLAAPRAAAAGARERWLVAVNPDCLHCRAHLEELSRALAHDAAPPLLSVLVIDTASRPRIAALDSLAPGGVWWDSSDVWRRRWRHGAYAEVMVFDARGIYTRTLPPSFVPAAPAAR